MSGRVDGKNTNQESTNTDTMGSNEFAGICGDVELLNQMVYEWIRRTMYYSSIGIQYTVVREIADQFAHVLNIGGYNGSLDWFTKFRKYYALGDTTKGLNFGYKRKKSLTVQNIVRDVLSERGIFPLARTEAVKIVNTAQPATSLGVGPSSVSLDVKPVISDIEAELPSSILQKVQVKEAEFPSAIMEKELDFDELLPKSVCTPKKPKTALVFKSDTPMTVVTKKQIEPPQNPPQRKEAVLISPPFRIPVKVVNSNKNTLRTIVPKPAEAANTDVTGKKSTRFSGRGPLKHDEALKCIKLMEEFAMLKDNFRLIGLIERLEHIIREGK